LADFLQPTQTVEGIEIMGIAGSEFTGLQVAPAQSFIAKGFGALPREKMKTQPTAIAPGNALGFAKKSDESEKD
jgi:hypothetical protein